MSAETFTARRSWSSVHPDTRQATVIVYDQDGIEVARAGGARAARAQAVIVARHGSYPKRRTLGIYGLRSDAAAADVEARRLATATTTKARGAIIPTVPYAVAVAVPVVDDDDVAYRAIQKLHADHAAQRGL